MIVPSRPAAAWLPATGRENPQRFDGVVKPGFQLASGRAVVNPYGQGVSTIATQMPFFKERGVDLEELVPGWNPQVGTINVHVPGKWLWLKTNPSRTDIITMSQVDWTKNLAPELRIDPEDFSLVRVTLPFNGEVHQGLLYYPHPDTKPRANNIHNYDCAEFIMPSIKGIKYGVSVQGFEVGPDTFEVLDTGAPAPQATPFREGPSFL